MCALQRAFKLSDTRSTYAACACGSVQMVHSTRPHSAPIRWTAKMAHRSAVVEGSCTRPGLPSWSQLHSACKVLVARHRR